MMLMQSSWERALDLDGDSLKTIVVESQELLSSFLLEFNEQLQGLPGSFILSEDYKEIPIKGNVTLIFNPFILSQK